MHQRTPFVLLLALAAAGCADPATAPADGTEIEVGEDGRTVLPGIAAIR